ncbi:cadherin repeat domain-containing protein [uncultured Psychroserpens sp.]|uniref:cadherin repeat domain-containing protein n=1 Tax=uncultured Psychroserpens sp. TaxID=255436 RepID=UPI00260F912B|nr:cadherin repeat domain-containing protein [uncultured Psychroserpens sp.]
MKSILKKTVYLCILFSTFILSNSCSSDDGPTTPPIVVSSINNTINEHPENGTFIGIITTDMTGTLSFSIASQTPIDAFSINSTTGEVLVNDNTKFDYEINASLNATISVTNGMNTATSSVNVMLNNIDDIAFFLSNSQEAYNTAGVGDWITITEAEYNTLATSLTDITKTSTTDEHYDYDVNISTASSSANGISFANDNGATIPTNSFLFAFKYYTANGPIPNTTKVKTSTSSATTGYSDLGSVLPEVHQTGNHYFVLKGNDIRTNNTGYLGIYTNLNLGFRVIDDPTNYNFTFSDNSDLDNVGGTNSAIIMYQGLSSTQKQWD